MKTTFLSNFSDCKLTDLKPCVMTLGFFDGIHLGHRKLIEKAKCIAQQKQLELTVLTFFPHPKEILNQVKFNYLMPIEKKIEMFEKLGIENLYVVHFDEPFANLEPKTFVQKYLVSLNVKEAVIGFDFTYGRKSLGNAETLEIHGNGAFQTTIVSKVDLRGKKISSTLIRNLLSLGRVEQIPYFLGDYYQTDGAITKILRHNNFNSISEFRIDVASFNSVPKCGIYEVVILLNNNKFHSICNVYEKKGNEILVEVEFPRNVRINDYEEITIKWLKQQSVNKGKVLQRLFS